MNPLRTLGVTLGLALSASMLVACGDGDSDTPTDVPTTPASQSAEPTDPATTEATETPTETVETPTESPEATETSAAPEATGSTAELTAPGTALKIGDSAIVPGDYAGKDFVMEVTVTKIEQAKPGALDDMKSKSFDPKKYAGAYVHLTAKVLSGTAENANPGSEIQGMIGDEYATSLIKFSAFAPCENETFEDGKVGEEVTTCEMFVAPKGSKVDGAAYKLEYDEQPIQWN